MPHTPLDPELEAGLRTMPPHQASETAIKLTATLVAGVAFLGFNLAREHPINRAFHDMRAWMQAHSECDTTSIEDLIALVERVCFQIWTLSVFQADPVKSQLRELLEPICNPPESSLADPAGR